MNFNSITNLQSCSEMLALNREMGYLSFIYYSHIPTAIISLLFGIFILFKNKKDLSGRIFFFVALFFSLWSFSDLILWTSVDSRLTMFFWSIINLLENFVSALTFYFVYVFVEKKDLAFKYKAALSSLFLPYVFLLQNDLNVTGFNDSFCEASQGPFVNYFYFLEVFFFLVLLGYLAKKIIRTAGEERKMIIHLAVGAVFFLLSFSGANIAGSVAAVVNPENPDNWKILQYGLFGMPVFTGFLTYLIVKYKAFDIKIFAAQALVAALVILVGSQFFFIKTLTNQILTGFTLGLAALFGYVLVRSVKLEIRRKEELQRMTEQLAIANDNLRKLDNAKSEFISIASHQLRTPLTSIKGFISLLLEGSYGKMKEEHRQVLNKVFLSNERLINLVEDLLNLSRIESGRMQYEFEKVSLENSCKEIYETFTMRARDKKLKLKLNLPKEKLPLAEIDKKKIREVISNVIDNAIKYTDKGEVEITPYQRENFVGVKVRDTGIGIPQEEMSFLFQKFSRGKDVARLNAGGMGLGLHVGRSMMEDMGGRIWVESPGAGQGSTFFIEMPVERG